MISKSLRQKAKMIPPEQLDKKLNALLNRSTAKSLYNKYTSLSLIDYFYDH